MEVKVSSTPSPFAATAGNSGACRPLRARERAAIVDDGGQVALVVLEDEGDA